jgi:hypothetical protein
MCYQCLDLPVVVLWRYAAATACDQKGPKVQFLFADYLLDLNRRELTRGSAAIAIGPRVFDLLVYLVASSAPSPSAAAGIPRRVKRPPIEAALLIFLGPRLLSALALEHADCAATQRSALQYSDMRRWATTEAAGSEPSL